VYITKHFIFIESFLILNRYIILLLHKLYLIGKCWMINNFDNLRSNKYNQNKNNMEASFFIIFGLQVIGYKNNFRTIHSRCIFRIFGVYTIYTYIKWQLFYMLSIKQAIHNRLSDKTGGINHKVRIKLLTL
jgi:hypothetical protein